MAADDNSAPTNGVENYTVKIMDQKRIAVIGAGACGITAAKCCLEENLDVVVFEMANDIGGLWRYHDDDVDNLPSVMKSTIINTSKEMSAFSDFPPPKEFPNFMHNSYMLRYFRMYAEKFGILPHVRLCTEVIDVSPTEDYERSGRWYVTVKKMQDGYTYREAFDGVMIATGHHTYPNWPKLPGLDEFEGKVIHTHSLKNTTGYEDKKVLIIGIGNSAADAAVEISTVAKKVYLSTRSGAWVYQRVGPNGEPFDVTYWRRSINLLQLILPFRFKCWIMERRLNDRFDHGTYGIKPKHRVLNQHPTINDALPNKLLSGTVILREDIKKFTKTGVVFKNDEFQTDIDAVILATGYHMKFPFISEEIINVRDNKVEMYKYMFPPLLTHPSLAVVGLLQVTGGMFPVAEAQCRWYALLMSGKRKLPSREVMLSDIKYKNKANEKRYVSSPRHTIQVDYIPFLDELANLIGCKPNFFKLFFTNPKLFWTCTFGPSVPYQYRLRGPHSWQGSKEAILSSKERTLAALKTRKGI